MDKFTNVRDVKQAIDFYEEHFTGAPLLIGIDRNADYTALLGLLKDDYGKQIIRVSDSCDMDFPPDPEFQISVISRAAKANPVVWVGAAPAKMLYSQQATESFMINLLGSSFGGPVAVLCPFCCNVLENIGRKYNKLGYNIAIIGGDERDIPSIHVSPKNALCMEGDIVHGIKGLLQILEDGKYQEDILLETSCKFVHLAASMYPASEGIAPYQALCRKEPGIAANTKESNGTMAEWQKLAYDLQGAGSLSALCENRLCSVQTLRSKFGDYIFADHDIRFFCFVCLKAFYGNGTDYLAYCLQKSNTVEDLEGRIYTAILDIDHTDGVFPAWIRQRRRMLSTLDENSALMKDFCERATIKGKDILWYVGDETEEERAALIHALCSYSYTSDELERVLGVASPILAAYMQQFTFDEFNTRVMESDSYVRAMLTDYFQRYKLQKLTNRQEKNFIELVEAEAKVRSFTKLQSRSAIIKKIDKRGARSFFIDALGAEFLAFLQSKAEEYGMQFECFVGHCNLPSITSKNKEFYDVFPEGSVLKEEGLDELKHRGTKYDFQTTTEPLHIFDELAILDRDLKKMRSLLVNNDQCQRIIILSDHGASRLAVTYRSENDKLELSEPGQHSGRCCPAEKDPGIDFVTYEDGFAVLANYERFKATPRR